MDIRLCISSILTLALAATLLPQAASAQSVRGRVFDAQSGSPVAVAEIVMREKNGDLVVTMMSTDDGSFSSEVGRKGTYVLTVSHLGYDSTTTAEVKLGRNEDLWIEIELAPQAIDIPGLTVVTQSQYRPRLEGVGFYQRRRQGIGTLFEPLAWEQGFRVPLDEMLQRHTRGDRPCPVDPNVVPHLLRLVNGRLDLGQGIAGSTWHVIAMEVYGHRSDVPPQWLRYMDAEHCGVVMIWTR